MMVCICSKLLKIHQYNEQQWLRQKLSSCFMSKFILLPFRVTLTFDARRQVLHTTHRLTMVYIFRSIGDDQMKTGWVREQKLERADQITESVETTCPSSGEHKLFSRTACFGGHQKGSQKQHVNLCKSFYCFYPMLLFIDRVRIYY